MIKNNKPMISLCPASAWIHMSEAFREGQKHGPYNWREDKVKATELLDKIFRHLLAVLDGEDIDLASPNKKHHLAGVLADTAIYLDAYENKTLIDDRPKKGRAGDMIREIEERPKGMLMYPKAGETLKEMDSRPAVYSKGEMLLGKLDDTKCSTMEEHTKNMLEKKSRYYYGDIDNKK